MKPDFTCTLLLSLLWRVGVIIMFLFFIIVVHQHGVTFSIPVVVQTNG